MKKNSEKITFEKVETHIDLETGEIVKSSTYTSAVIPKEPPHVKIYLDDIASINNLPPSASKLLHLLIRHMGYNNMVPMLKPFKQMICSELGIKNNTLEHILGQLLEHGIIHRFARGLYILDPNLFAKGKWEDIKKLRLIIEYDKETGKRKLISNAPEELKQISIKFD